ncbi:MAG: arginine deiminase family protein [Robiginitalea sp.]|nr:arginine deiminase family protein [Robiginitalea sp.]
MKLTCHSESLPLHSVLIRPLLEAFRDQATIASQWEGLNYLSEPRMEVAIEQYTKFESLLKAGVREVYRMPRRDDLTLDALYCRDASIATDFGMILCRMGKEARQLEPASHREVFDAMGIPILGSIEAPGTLEGGDVAWLDTRTLAVGHSYRTNASGIEQLKALLEPKGIEVIVADLPHFRGPSDVFHLMSILSPVDRDLAVVYAPLMPISFRNILLDRGYDLVEVPEVEFDTLGSNVLATSPRNCILAAGNPQTEAALRQAGCAVTTYEGSEISLKGGGGPTCLTRPYQRRLQG